MARRVARTRVLIYTSILMAVIVAAGVSLWHRTPVKMDVIRDRGTLAREVEGGRIENIYRLQVMNTQERAQRFTIGVAGPVVLGELQLLSEAQPIEIPPVTTRAIAVRVRAAPGAPHGLQPIEFTLATEAPAGAPEAGSYRIVEKSRFIVP
jgi:polyferredoxin